MDAKRLRTLLVADDSVSAAVRVHLPAKILTKRGYNITVNEYRFQRMKEVPQFPQVLFQRPTVDLRQVFTMLKQLGSRIVVDFDDDFLSVPKTHPGYNILGPGNPVGMQNMLWAVQNCDVLTVSTLELQNRFSTIHRNVHVIPNLWDDTNPAWTDPLRSAALRWHPERINVGWVGSLTHRDDFRQCVPHLIRLCREYPNLRVMIGADVDIYDQLVGIPEHQKLFIPGLPYEDYPWLIRHFDIMLVPLLDTPLNQAKSDIKLVEAGAAGIPFIASDVLPYQNAAGGLRVGKDGWYAAIKLLLDDPGLRLELGKKGQQEMNTRRASADTLWENILFGGAA